MGEERPSLIHLSFEEEPEGLWPLLPSPTTAMRLSAVVACLAYLAGAAVAQTRFNVNEVTRGLLMTSASPQVNLYANLTGKKATTIRVIPCYGQYNYYTRFGRAPTTTSSTFKFTWKPQPVSGPAAAILPQTYNSSLGLLFQGQGSFNKKSYIGKADLIVTDQATSFEPILTNPTIDATVKEGGTEATLEWTTTGNPLDSYKLYEYKGEVDEDSGFVDYTACGVIEFMSDVTSQYDIDYDGRDATATITGLDKESPYQYKVVVFRQGGYMADYNLMTVNDASGRASSFLVVPVALVALFSW
jgi:hypothetical protein